MEQSTDQALQGLLFGNGSNSPKEELAEDELLVGSQSPLLEELHRLWVTT